MYVDCSSGTTNNILQLNFGCVYGRIDEFQEQEHGPECVTLWLIYHNSHITFLLAHKALVKQVSSSLH